jgi:hypothetical protein
MGPNESSRDATPRGATDRTTRFPRAACTASACTGRAPCNVRHPFPAFTNTTGGHLAGGKTQCRHPGERARSAGRARGDAPRFDDRLQQDRGTRGAPGDRRTCQAECPSPCFDAGGRLCRPSSEGICARPRGLGGLLPLVGDDRQATELECGRLRCCVDAAAGRAWAARVHSALARVPPRRSMHWRQDDMYGPEWFTVAAMVNAGH